MGRWEGETPFAPSPFVLSYATHDPAQPLTRVGMWKVRRFECSRGQVLIDAETASHFVFFYGLGVLEFDGIISPKNKINQDPHNLAIVLQERHRLINAQGLGSRYKCDEVGIAGEPVQCLR